MTPRPLPEIRPATRHGDFDQPDGGAMLTFDIYNEQNVSEATLH
jgi:hypothetical protein